MSKVGPRRDPIKLGSSRRDLTLTSPQLRYCETQVNASLLFERRYKSNHNGDLTQWDHDLFVPQTSLLLIEVFPAKHDSIEVQYVIDEQPCGYKKWIMTGLWSNTLVLHFIP